MDDDSELPGSAAALPELESLARAGTRTKRELDGREVPAYRCQATEAPAASEPLRGFDVRQYAREVACGNLGPIHAAWVLGRAAGLGVLQRLGLRSNLALGPSQTTTVSPEMLGLQLGELVQVRSKNEIAATLDQRGKNRGLWFDVEMVPRCGGTYRVQRRVERFIDDRTGQMVELPSDVWSSTASYAAASTRAGGSSVHGPSSRGGERLGCAESGTKTLRHAARLGRTAEQRPAARSVVESGITGGIRVAGSDRAEPRHLRGSP